VLGRIRSARCSRRAAAALTAGLLSGALVLVGAPDAAADSYFSAATGSHSVIGAILDEYRSIGGPQGRLGYPVTDELPTPVKFGRANHFERGSIYWSPGTGAHELFGAIGVQWASLGWENGLLGFPVTDEFPVGHGGIAQNFQGGSVYWSSATGAHSVIGAIRERWGALGWEQGYLGLPVTDEISLGPRGAYSLFQGGAIYWSPTTGAHAIRGAIAARWAELGWENGPLGFPVSDENPLPGGASSHFQGGTISWSPSTGAHVVVGAIRDLWARMGWETNSPLGYPVSDEYSVPGGRRSDFQHGSITWTPLLGAAPDVTITGTGTRYVPLDLGSAPMMVASTYSGASGNFSVEAVRPDGGYNFGDLLVNEIGAYSGTASLNMDFPSSPVQAFQVTAGGPWSLHLMPLAWATPFDRFTPMNGTGSTVLHYVGPPGIIRIDNRSSGHFAVVSYSNRGGYLDLMTNAIRPTFETYALPPDVYLEVTADGPWTIDVV
jgi:hypothetical protein